MSSMCGVCTYDEAGMQSRGMKHWLMIIDEEHCIDVMVGNTVTPQHSHVALSAKLRYKMNAKR